VRPRQPRAAESGPNEFHRLAQWALRAGARGDCL
jgi:hypothetical protein